MKRRLFIAAVALHFLILLSGAFPKLAKTPVGGFLNVYSRVTGSGSSFGFFSPDVANQLTVTFLVEEGDRQTRVRMQDLVSKETSIRVGNMYRFFTQVYAYPRIRRSVAASLSAHVFEKRPGATRVTFEADKYRLPNLAEYRTERKVYVSPVYRASFRRE